MNVYFIRHGESEGNLNQILQEEAVSLTSTGIHQAYLVAKRFKNIPVNVIYSSPYQRAKQTAEIISKELKTPVMFWKWLRELKAPSEITGLKYSHPKAKKVKAIIQKNQSKPDWKYSDGESYNNLFERAREVEYQLIQHQEGDNILCITHVQIMTLVVLRAILQEKLTPEIYWQFYYHCKQMNTAVTQLEYTKNLGWCQVTWNDTAHL